MGRNAEGRTVLAKGADEFICYALKTFNCHFLTTHCKGNAQTVIDYLSQYCLSGLLEKLRAIKPTNFDKWKTEGIDFSKEFIWIDDYLFNAEIEILKSNGRMNSWIQVNSYRDQTALVNLLRTISVDNP